MHIYGLEYCLLKSNRASQSCLSLKNPKRLMLFYTELIRLTILHKLLICFNIKCRAFFILRVTNGVLHGLPSSVTKEKIQKKPGFLLGANNSCLETVTTMWADSNKLQQQRSEHLHTTEQSQLVYPNLPRQASQIHHMSDCGHHRTRQLELELNRWSKAFLPDY